MGRWVAPLIAVACCSSQIEARVSQRVAPPPSKVRAIPASGILNAADLAAIAELGATPSSDRFSDNPSLGFMGRDFVVDLSGSDISVDFDRESQVLTAVIAKYADSVVLNRKISTTSYAGQNAFGAKTRVSKVRGKTFGIWLPGSIYARGPLTYTANINGEAARALSKDVTARITGKVIKAAGAYAEEASVIMKKSLITEASLSSPIDTWIEGYSVAVSIDKIEWIDGRTGQTLSAAK